MKEFTSNNKEYILVEVPTDTYDFKYKLMPDNNKQLVGTIKDDGGNVGTCYIRENTQGKIIGLLSDILKDENICKKLVESKRIKESWNDNMTTVYFNYLCDYRANLVGKYTQQSTSSFLSYLQSISLDMTKEYLLISKL